MDEKVRVLQTTPLCMDLTIPQIKKMSTIAVFEEFNPGELLFEEGDKAQGLYILTLGKVKVFKLSQGGKEQILNVFGPGQTVGEAAMFSGGVFPASAMAQEFVRTLWVGRERLMKLMAWEPRLAMGMLSVMARRLHHFARVVDELSLQDVPTRLARYLLERSTPEQSTMHLELKKIELAQRLGTAPETLSRALKKLTQLKFIRNQGSTIKILAREQLMQFASEGK